MRSKQEQQERERVIALMRHFVESEGDSRREAKERAEDKLEDGDYMVKTDEEADEAAREYILDSVWAFRPGFLVYYMPEGVSEEVIQAVQGSRCNAALLAMIEDQDHFVSEAISADGRGHFLSTYDGEENEQKVGDNWYFIYRVN